MRKHTRLNLLLCNIVAIVTICFSSCAAEEQLHEYCGWTWGTTFHIKYYASRLYNDSIEAEMNRIERVFNYRYPGSEVQIINDDTTNVKSSMPVSNEFISLFKDSKDVNSLSGGAFDPTIGPICSVWGFGGKDSGTRNWDGRYFAPSQAQIDSALARVGIDECHIAEGYFLKKKHRNTKFDFSALAKGYGVDCVVKLLEKYGVKNLMVEIGGEVAARGEIDGRKWTLSIDDPGNRDVPGTMSLDVIEIDNMAVATSSNSRRYHYLVDGTKYGHIFSPKNGMPIENDMLSTTIIYENCKMADAIATACMAMTSDEAIKMVENNDIAALFVIDSKDSGESRIYYSKKWKKLEAERSKK